jgi:hypothetical protein
MRQPKISFQPASPPNASARRPRHKKAAAFTLTVAALVCISDPHAAHAVDWYTGAAAAPKDNWIVAVDSSVTVTSTGSQFVDLGVTSAIDGTLNDSGIRARVEGLAGHYAYNSTSDGSRINGFQQEGSFLAGYEWIGKNARLSGFAGLDVRNNSLSSTDPNDSVVGTTAGLKSVLEFYLKPTTSTFFSAYGSYTTNEHAYYTRAKTGYAIADDVYVGPEFSFLGNDFFSQWRMGGHLTGWRVGNFQLAIAGGYLYDRMQKSGAYSTIDMRVGF